MGLASGHTERRASFSSRCRPTCLPVCPTCLTVLTVLTVPTVPTVPTFLTFPAFPAFPAFLARKYGAGMPWQA